MDRFLRSLWMDFRAFSPARIYVAIASLGTLFIGLGYLIAPKDLVSETVLYQALENYGSVRPFAAWTMFVGFMMILASLRNSRARVAFWSLQTVMIWVFIGVLFLTEFPEAWFTAIVLWPLNFFAALYSRYLAMRPPNKDDDKFDEHVDKTRESLLN